MMEIITKPKLSIAISHLKRPDAEICQDKHLLANGAEPEREDTALLFAYDPHHQKGQDHTGKGIEKASGNVPEHIVTFFVVTGTQKQRTPTICHYPFLRFRKFWISRMEIRILAM